MRLLSSTQEGDRFRVAHPDQVSLNGIRMYQADVYRVNRVYCAKPYIRVCYPFYALGDDRRIRTLMPNVPILSEKEGIPTIEQVEKFLLGPLPKTKVVMYELTWDGEAPIGHLLQPQERTVFTRLWISGKRRFTVEEMRSELSKIRLSGKITAARAFQFYVPHLAELGLLKETRERRSSAARKLHEIVGA